jgi:type VI secretion system protein ImpE
MLAETSLASGQLDMALSQLQDQIRKDPAKVEYRTFLFQLLAVMGQWDRAATQLKVAGEMDVGTLAMVKTYETALQCEVFRKEVFGGQRSPLIFGHPPQWLALQLQALQLQASEQNLEQSQKVRTQAFELAPTVSGTINGEAFDWLADADPRIGPAIEAVIKGQYYWIPLENIVTIHIEAPSDLRDLIWLPSHFTWTNGGETVGLIPTRYPGSEQIEDAQIQMSKKTEWIDKGHDLFTGIGQRMLTTDINDYPLMEVREIHFDNEIDQESAVTQE